MNLAEAEELVALARARQRVWSVCHNRRFDADFLALQDVLASGRLGRLVYFESHFGRYRPQGACTPEQSAGRGGIWPDLGVRTWWTVRDAVRGVGPNPVTPEQASQVMVLLELGRESALQRRELRVPPHH